MLIHGQTTREDMRAINAIGYLTSDYDNYTDILPVEQGKDPDSTHDTLPQAAVMNADGTRMKAWLTFDKKTQYMKRCPSLWESRARTVIAGVLKRLPYLGRFIDVTTAEGLYECYDPEHPLSRTDKRRCGERLLRSVEGLGLVVGGEHGIWWGVPHLHYIEGMMSSYQFAWPAGHLIRPKDRAEKFAGPYGTDTWENYERWGLGHEHRAPLWQLVFHDCVVSTWYWGDSNDFLLRAAPELTPKKDAYNVLYGTIPMMWANRDGAWHADRRAFLRTAHTATPVHAVTAESEMTDHAFVTPDRAVQRTRFANGTECVVNFGAANRRVVVAGKSHLLPQNGFAAIGPGLRMFKHITGDREVTTVDRPGFLYSEDRDSSIIAWAERKGVVRVAINGAGRQSVVISRLIRLASPSGASRFALYRRDAADERTALVAAGPPRNKALTLTQGSYDLLVGDALNKPDLAVELATVPRARPDANQGTPLNVEVILRNIGGRPARSATVTAYADRPSADRALVRMTVSLGSGAARRLILRVPTDRMDGQRTLVIVATAGEGDLCTANDRLALPVYVRPDTRRWKHSAVIVVEGGLSTDGSEPIVVPIRSARLKPASVRVWELGSHARAECAAQCDTLPEGKQLCFVPRTPIPSGSSRRFRVIWNEDDQSGPAPLPILSWRLDPKRQTFVGQTYSFRLSEGMIRDVRRRAEDGTEKPIISKIMVSSAETGWTEEPGSVMSFSVQAEGPVRTIISITKQLRNNVKYTKRYVLFATGFNVEARVTPQVAITSRAYYHAGGAFMDSQGNTAIVDGKGDAEDVINRGSGAEWYEVRGTDWAHSCIAVTPHGGLAYWDSSEWGGIGFVGPAGPLQTIAYRFYARSMTAGFASRDRTRILSAPTVRVLEGKL